MTKVQRMVAMGMTGALALPASAAAADRPPDAEELSSVGLRVAWPVSEHVPAFYARERLVVRVGGTAAAGAEVALERVDARGGATRVVTRRAVREGSAGITVPAAGGRLRLVLEAAGRRWFSSFTARPLRPATRRCPAGRRLAADLSLSQGAGAPGAGLRVELRNTGRACLTPARDHHWERRLPGGGWEVVAGARGPSRRTVVLGPGRRAAYAARVPAALEPGAYRLVQKATSPDGPLVLSVPFEVTAAGA